MGKSLFFLLFIFLFIGSAFAETDVNEVNVVCSDSDGLNYFTKGLTKGLNPENNQYTELYDTCVFNGSLTGSCEGSDCKLLEGVCNESFVSLVSQSCEKGCANGRCIKTAPIVCEADYFTPLEKDATCIVTYNKIVSECVIPASNENGHQCTPLPQINIAIPENEEGYSPVEGVSGNFSGVICSTVSSTFNGSQFFFNCDNKKSIIKSCFDSDGQENFEKSGYIIVSYTDGTTTQFDDTCGSSSGGASYGAVDYFCGELADGSPHYWSAVKECEYGCSKGVCIDSNDSEQACSEPICYGLGPWSTGLVDKTGCAIMTCYPGYNLSLDKTEYTDNDTILLEITGEESYVNISIGSPTMDESKIIMKKVLVENKRKIVKISIDEYKEIFSQSGQYIIGTSAYNEEIIGGRNTNSVIANVTMIESPLITEEILCIFKGSKTGNECYIAGDFDDTDGGTKWCKGTESCIINYTGQQGEKVVWKSSCGGYQYTNQDGKNETIIFNCEQGEIIDSEIVPTTESYFRKAYYECSNGEKYKEGGESVCNSYSSWKQAAIKACITPENVTAFSLTNICYPEIGAETPIIQSVDSNSSTIVVLGTATCKDSCSLDNKCYPFGYRKESTFCSDVGEFVLQAEANKECNNNFECSSNVCVNNKCISSDLLQQIIDWFKNLFGIQ